MTSRYIVGDVRDVLADMPDASVDLILTSPPFLALRSYLPADHPDKHREIGSEPTPGAFIDTLLDLTETWARVLAPHGTLAVELGDTYSGSGGAGGDYGAEGWREGQPRFDGSGARARPKHAVPDARIGPGRTWEHERARRAGKRDGMTPHDGWPAAKSLCLIAESYRWALVYGRNPFTGRATPRWRVRNVVRWCRPNPPVGALSDKFRPATSDLVIACMSAQRWFDLDAVRTDESAPPRDYWEIPTQPYAGAHYATWPERLCIPAIDAMCPREVCRQCGEPRRRITAPGHIDADTGDAVDVETVTIHDQGAGRGRASRNGAHARANSAPATLGWTDCGHGDYRRGVVLDPFAGSGTTLAVAEGLARDSIGVDVDERNLDLALDRCGMFLTVEHVYA